MHGPFADSTLAARLEGFAARDLRRFVDAAVRAFPDSRAEVLEVGGGVAAYCMPGAPFNQAIGMGLADPVTAPEIDLLETFFANRSERVRVNVCPLADPSLTAELSRRGYLVAEFENVLVRPLNRDDDLQVPDPSIEIRIVSSVDREEWALGVVRGFSVTGSLTDADKELSRLMAVQDGAIALLAIADGAPVGTAELVIDEGVGWLSADTTLPAYRRQGVQIALQRARLRLARDGGCDLAVSEARPGGTSQRNMERLGFRIAYTRVDMLQAEE